MTKKTDIKIGFAEEKEQDLSNGNRFNEDNTFLITHLPVLHIDLVMVYMCHLKNTV